MASAWPAKMIPMSARPAFGLFFSASKAVISSADDMSSPSERLGLQVNPLVEQNWLNSSP